MQLTEIHEIDTIRIISKLIQERRGMSCEQDSKFLLFCQVAKCFHELPENAFIVRVVWQRKKAVEVEKANGPGGIATRKSKRMKQLPA